MKNSLFLLVLILILKSNNSLNAQNELNEHKHNQENNKKFRMERVQLKQQYQFIEGNNYNGALEDELRRYYRDKINNEKNELYLANKLDKDKLLSVELANGRLKGQWYERGSKNNAGRTHCSEFIQNTNELLVGSSGGNIWRGTIEQDNWVCLNNAYQFDDIHDVKYLNNNNIKNRIYVAANRMTYYSDNNGVSWHGAKGLEHIQLYGNIERSIVNVENGKYYIYLLLIMNDNTIHKPVKALFLSTNNGESFSIVHNFKENKIADIWGDQEKAGIYIQFNDSLFAYNQTNKLSFVNTINVNNSKELENNIKMTGSHYDNKTVIYLAFDLMNTRAIYKYSSESNYIQFKGIAHTFMFMRNSLACSKLDENRLWIGGVDCFVSLNSGATWDTINSWVQYYNDPFTKLHADIPGINVFKIDETKEYVVASTDGGTYYASNDNYSFYNLSLENLNVSQYYSTFSTQNLNENYVYAGSQDQGFQIGVSEGNNHIDLDQIYSGDYGCLSSSNNGNTIWAVYPGFAIVYPNLHQSRMFQTWGFEGKYENRVWMPPIYANPLKPTSALIACGGPNNNSIIQMLHYNVNTEKITIETFNYVFDSEDAFNDVSALAISPLDTNYYYAMTKRGYFYSSTDRGKTWAKTDNFKGPSYNYLHSTSIIPSKITKGVVYIAGGGYSSHGVFVTNNNGATFDSVGLDIPKAIFYEIDINTEENVLFAATSVGPYIYFKGNNRWYPMTAYDTPDQTYWSVEYLPTDKIVRFGTYGRGIWDFKIEDIFTTVSDNNEQKTNIDVNIYPNPANKSVNFDFNSISQIINSAKIFDINGNLIYEINTNDRINGIFKWNFIDNLGRKVNSGTYILIYIVNGINYYNKFILE